MHRENVKSCNLLGFKGKVNTLVEIKGNIRSLAPSLLIKLYQPLSPLSRPSLRRITLSPLVIIIIITFLSWYC